MGCTTLSNVINYVQYNKTPKNFHDVIIKPVNNSRINKRTKDENIDESSIRAGLASISNELWEEYLDRYKRIKYHLFRKITYDSRRQFDDRREVFNNRTQVYCRQAIRWYRMSEIARHWSK